MLSLEDCIGLCGLGEEGVLAIAEHENIPEIAAAELASCLVQTHEGERRIKAIIREDIRRARLRGDRRRELALKLLLRDFVLQHPCCEERHRARPPALSTRMKDKATR